MLGNKKVQVGWVEQTKQTNYKVRQNTWTLEYQRFNWLTATNDLNSKVKTLLNIT